MLRVPDPSMAVIGVLVVMRNGIVMKKDDSQNESYRKIPTPRNTTRPLRHRPCEISLFRSDMALDTDELYSR